MARGWESKSVEEQMATMQQPVVAVSGNISEAKRVADLERQHKARQKQALEMQRENILSQRTSNPARRAALEQALTQIEAQLVELG
jgi:hypothetical protein